jgi:hypothetical protein
MELCTTHRRKCETSSRVYRHLFEAIGFNTIGPIDGHDVIELVTYYAIYAKPKAHNYCIFTPPKVKVLPLPKLTPLVIMPLPKLPLPLNAAKRLR